MLANDAQQMEEVTHLHCNLNQRGIMGWNEEEIIFKYPQIEFLVVYIYSSALQVLHTLSDIVT